MRSFDLSKKITKPFIFVSHAPPYGTNLDVLSSKEHVGSHAVRDFITRWAKDGRLIVSFHGHIHELPNVSGSIITEIEGVPCINPGQGEGQRPALQFSLFDLEGMRITLVHLPKNSPEDK